MKLKFSLLAFLAISCITIAGSAQDAFALIIDNDIAPGTLNHFRVDVDDGGEAFSAFINRGGGVLDDQLIFDYFTYIDTNGIGVAGGDIRLVDFTVVPVFVSGDDKVTSSGTFTGSAGNTISWTAVSSVAAGQTKMETTYTFTAQSGTLGVISLIQYLDEDVPPNFGDCDLFIFGSAVAGDLELLTFDHNLIYGVSQSGAYNAAQGLVNAAFDGFAAKEFPSLRNDLDSGQVSVSPTGVIGPTLSGLALHNHAIPLVNVIGPEDITTALSYTVNPSANTATIVTSLGGVPDATSIDGPIGGLILSTDTAALLLAGVQTSVFWVLPALVSAAGIGLFVIRRK